MTTCRCQHVPGAALQERLHAAHTNLAQLAQRYLPFVRKKQRDPELEVLLEHTRARMRAMHAASARYLPEGDLSRMANVPAVVQRQETPQERRTHHHDDSEPTN